MRYPEEVIQDIREGNDLVDFISNYTQLKAKGNNYFGICPFHKESTPSFCVNPDKQLYYCFGCGATGNIFNFVMQMENYDFMDSISFLAEKINYSLPSLNYSTNQNLNEINYKKKTLYDIHKLVARFYYENLHHTSYKSALNYLKEREILPATYKKFGLGYSGDSRNKTYLFLKENGFSDDIILESGLVLKDKEDKFYDRFISRLMFPIIDTRGRIIAFGGRLINQNKNYPKYLNSPDTLIFNKSQNLYAINFAKLYKNKEFILVEGYMDAIAMHQAGFNNVIASLGTAFNKNHSKAIKRFTNNLILLFDNDEAGTNAILRAIPILKEEDFNIKVLQLQKAKDPDEFIKNFGKDILQAEINNSKSYISFQIEQKLKLFSLNDSFQKIQLVKEISKIIATLNDSIEREVFIKEASLITSISYENILKEVESSLKNFVVNNKQKNYINNFNIVKNKNNQLESAQNSILNIIVNNLDIFDKVKNVLSYKEFINEPYCKLAKIIYEFNLQKKHILIADLISYFDEVEYQQKISKIFMSPIDLYDLPTLEKAINDQIKIIKEAYINIRIQNLQNISSINSLINEKKNIKNLYIKL